MTSRGLPRVEIWLYSSDGPFDGNIGRPEDHHKVLYTILKQADTSLEPTKNPIKKGHVCVPTLRTAKQEPKDPEDSGVDTISDSESETSYSHGDIYPPRAPHKKGSAESLANHLLSSSLYIIKSTDGNGGARGNGAAGISSNGESSRSTPNGGSTTAGGGNQSNKRKHHGGQGPGRSKKPHVSDPQELDLASPCVFFIAEPNASKFQKGGSHESCRTKTFTKISDHNQHNNRRHPPLWCPKCKSKITDTEKAHQDHLNLCGGQLQENKAQAEEPNDKDRCRCFKDVAKRWLGDLSAYPKVMSDIEFRKAPVDIADAFWLFMQQDPAARKMGGAIRELFFRSSQFIETVQKHDILNEFKSGNDPYPDWDIGDIVWKTSWRGIPETPGTSNLLEGEGIDKSTAHNKNQSFGAASETGGNDTSTENCLSNPAGTPLRPESIPDAHPQPTADPMDSSPSSNPQALAPNASQEELSDAQLRTHKANKSSSSQLLRESNSLRNSSQTPRQHPSCQLKNKRPATARKKSKPSAATGPAAAISHASSSQAPSTPTTPHEHQRDQWGQSKADQTQSGSQGYLYQPQDRPDTHQPLPQPIQGFHSGAHDYHCSTMLDPTIGGNQVGVGTPPTDPGQDLCAGLSGVNTGFDSGSQYIPAPGNGTYLQGATPAYFGGQTTTTNTPHTQYTQLAGFYPQEIPPNDAQDGSPFNSRLTKNLEHETYPRTDQPGLVLSHPPKQAAHRGWALDYGQPNSHNNQSFDLSMPTGATGEQPLSNFFQQEFQYGGG